MPSCVLRISVCDFDVDRFLAESSLIPVAVYRKGDRRRPASRGISSMSGFNVDIGGADDDIADQSAAAIRFISANRQELERAHTDPGVEDLVLDFATQFRDVAVQGESFPADLVAAAGSVGASIAITLYPPSKD